MLNRLYSWVILFSLLSSPLAAAELKPFLPDSMQQILAERKGESFLLVLWSSDCPPCLREFEQLQQLKGNISRQRLVLISTDSPDDRKTVEQLLARYEMNRFDNWIFGDNFPERLRYHVDPGWFGELPRAYFYAPDHQRTVHSGILSRKFLENQLQVQPAADRPL